MSAVIRGDTYDILDATAALFGWHPDLLWVGYSHDIEGIFQRYDEYLRAIEAEFDLEAFTELHFQRRDAGIGKLTGRRG
jgi:hypothetical protein